jgi:son of sevenless
MSPRRRAAQLAGMNGYNASPDLPPPLFVRALYDYDADDQTSLSFRQGDIIQVITQLDSGWWDGVINEVRGWFPSNYCTVIAPDDSSEPVEALHEESEHSAESGTEAEYDEEEEDSDNHQDDDTSDLPIEGGDSQQEEAAFWVPQATPDGRLFYFNTLTGVSTMELPLETPSAPDETGPRERNNFYIPDQTRPPPEMMAGGYEKREDSYDGSASEAEGERSFLKTNRKGSKSVSTSTSTASTKVDMNTSRQINPRSSSFLNMSMGPLGTTATSFSAFPNPASQKSSIPKYFSDDGMTPPVTWNILVENMQTSVEAYRQAIQDRDRAEFVRRAEDISDHLRVLLAAGSGTTDNHSGNPSIISTNKALYPHFRQMMSKFSKLVLSSHMAAADWPGQDNFVKCLQEADGVLNGVYGYVEIARHQRGEEIPRILPGFVQNSKSGGNWKDNNIDQQTSVEGTSFIDESNDAQGRPSNLLDADLLRQAEEFRRNLVNGLRRLEENLQLTEKVITPARQAKVGDQICLIAGNVVENFRPWIALVESIDLSALGNVFQKPSLLDFGTQKQKVYDSIGELVTTCQAITAPLPDEWSDIRGDSLDTRLNMVRGCCKQLETHISNVGYALQLLLPASNLPPAATGSKREHRITDGGETFQNHHLRTEPAHAANQRPQLGDMGQSKSYTVGPDTKAERQRRPSNKDKATRFFGQVPTPLMTSNGAGADPISPQEDTPWFLQLDHAQEITYDTKVDPPQVKAGTLMGLVEQLTRHDRPDTTFNTIFLLTYQSFTTASELFEMLVHRFNLQPPPGLTRDEYSTWEEHKQKPVRFRVVNTLKTWLEHYWMENNDAETQSLLERASAFATTAVASAKIPGGAQIAAIIERRKKGQDTSAKQLVLTLTNQAPPPILPKSLKKIKFLDVDPTEFARQLTIMESKLFGKIRHVECLDKTWTKKGTINGVEPSPNVKSLILHSNQLTNWVAEMILTHQEVKKRVMVIKHFVSIADVSAFQFLCGGMFELTVSALSITQQLQLSNGHHLRPGYCPCSAPKPYLGPGASENQQRAGVDAFPDQNGEELQQLQRTATRRQPALHTLPRRLSHGPRLHRRRNPICRQEHGANQLQQEKDDG